MSKKPVDGFEFATEKDFERARGLEWKGRTFGYPLVVPNATKMAKLIKCKDKLIARLEAVSYVWDTDAVLPFIERLKEIDPTSKYLSRYRSGIHGGRYSMSPGGSSGTNTDRVERIVYNIGFSRGRHGNTR